jgi:hypothetical protein
MDNTALFFQLVQSYEQQSHGLGKSQPAGVASSLLHASSFTRAAAEVGRELHSTASKVQQLTKSACQWPVAPQCTQWASPHPAPQGLRRRPHLRLTRTLHHTPHCSLSQWCADEACLMQRAAAAAMQTG